MLQLNLSRLPTISFIETINHFPFPFFLDYMSQLPSPSLDEGSDMSRKTF